MLVVVTGVSRGLGKAMTAGLIEAGYAVAGCSRSADKNRELSELHGPPNRFDVVDVGDDQQVADWANSILADQGPPALLVNCAAIINRNSPLWELTAEEFSYVVDVNIKGVCNTIRHFVPAMIEQGRGVIVNFSSYWGRSTAPDVAAYCTTKWAIEGLSRGLADDLPGGLASVALNPGIIHTEMLASCFGSGAASYPSAEEWAKNSVPYLLELGPQHNGQSLTVPGY